MSFSIHSLGEDNAAQWDAFVHKSEHATFFHLAGWKTVLEKAFGHKTHFLYAQKEGEIAGILPLAQVKSFLFGNNLVALPFCVYGGILASSDEVHEALCQAACELARNLQVDSLELRNCEKAEADWPSKDLYVTFRKEIPQDPDEVLKFIPNKQRAVVRKGIKAELQGDDTWDARRIYSVYAESLRDLGTPVFSERYFRVLKEVFGQDCRSLMITHKGKDVAGVLSFYFKDQVLPYYAGSTEAARPLYAHGFMYWELMRRSAEEGIKIFDFGRSKVDTGSYSFKKNWGFTPEPLNYSYYLVGAKEMPEVNPTNPKYQLLIKTWKRLPLCVANLIGPPLAKYLG